MVRRVETVALAAPAQPVRHGVAAVGPRTDRAGCRVRPDRGGPQRGRRGAAGDPGRPAVGDARVVVLSRLVPHKQIEDALSAVAALAPRFPGLHLDVIGGGWWSDRLAEQAAALGIADAVTFHGHVDDVTKHELVQRAWVQVLPSRKEGWGLAVIEAAQHQVPTIGYRHAGGLTDSIVDGVTGLLVSDHRELVDSLADLLDDEVAAPNWAARPPPGPPNSPGRRAPRR
ncbi:glycosyltransferase [Mycolicibacterium insubricum]|uniref:glycosyltransferase n=1 Tax=Mycolicibacterium insubricum TaxID=444597 RepID=UPI0039089B20